MKLNKFRGEVTDVSAKKEPLLQAPLIRLQALILLESIDLPGHPERKFISSC